MSNVRVIPPTYPEVAAITATCQALAQSTAIDRFELAVKSRVEIGIQDDNELRACDQMLRHIVLNADQFEQACESEISNAHAKHKALVAELKNWISYDGKTKRWGGRWGALRESLSSAIIKYNKAKEELARQQQAQVDRAAAELRRQSEDAARKALRDGDVAGAQQAMDQARMVVAPMIATATPVLEHSSARKPWDAAIIDPMAVIKGIADGVIPMSVIKEWDLTFLKREASKLGGLDWPGIDVWQGDRLSVSRK